MQLEIKARHVTKQGAVFMYERRVPKRYTEVVGARRVRKSLATKDPTEAAKRAAALDHAYEARWKALLAGTSPEQAAQFDASVTLAEQSGFRYRDAAEFLDDPAEITRRTLALPADPSKLEVDGLLGTAERPPLTLSAAFEYTEARDLKTMSSERRIPLVGVSLAAFQAQPQGFPRYFDKNPQLSAVVNKYLKAQGLIPSKRHRLYSLRHAFEDRLIATGMDYRVRKEVMGHRIGDMAYGVGAKLEQVRDILQGIAFKAPPSI